MTRKLTDDEYVAEKVHGHYFREVTVENLRCFGKRQTLRLANKENQPYHWTIILGENGAGKTTLLKTLVGVAPSPKTLFSRTQTIRLYPGLEDWNRQWDTSRMDSTSPSVIGADIVAARTLTKPIAGGDLHLEVKDKHVGSPSIVYNDDSYAKLGDFLCFAYGASRRMGSASLSSDVFSTASVSLFDDDAPLINVEDFFMQADYEAKTSGTKDSLEQRAKVKRLLVEVLPDVSDLRISKTPPLRVEVKTPFGWVRLADLSLGYKSLIAWVVDFGSRMFHYHRTMKNPFHAPAVVLVDEIDLHLHPAWQRKILGYLSKRFPNTQFIATAHSPLIVQAALNANLVLLKRRGSQVMIDNAPDVIKNWRIDQILTSDIFGLSSARSEDAEKLLVQRRKLLLRPKLTKTDVKKLDRLEEQLGPLPVAETSEYIEAMKIIQKAATRA